MHDVATSAVVRLASMRKTPTVSLCGKMRAKSSIKKASKGYRLQDLVLLLDLM